MKKLAGLIGAALSLCVYATPSHAQATRTWVSGVGDDFNPCSRTAPCKTFSGAISKTATGGEINCLDPAGYGTLTVTKSITVDCGYTHGSVLAANVNGFIINAAGIVVNLRGLSINGATTTTGNGIRILNAASVNIDNCVIENFGGASPSNGRGVSIETATANVEVTIQNSRFANNNFIGVHSNPSNGNVLLTVNNTSFASGNNTAIQLRQLTTATVDHVTVTNHAGAGVTAELGNVTAAVSNSNFSNNQFGIFNGNGGAPTTRIYGSVITGSTVSALSISAGQVISSGNNIIRGNAGNEAPSSTPGMQ